MVSGKKFRETCFVLALMYWFDTNYQATVDMTKGINRTHMEGASAAEDAF